MRRGEGEVSWVRRWVRGKKCLKTQIFRFYWVYFKSLFGFRGF
nr:MAG TPA: hypothetical protein [Caudoviricetes sp.]